jgi:hypothetical protein
MNLLNQHQHSISELCEKFKVKEMYAFGSILNDLKFGENSDVDLMVNFNKDVPVEKYAELYFDLADNLELLFDRKVDLLLQKAISNRMLLENIEETKRIIYEA